MEQQSYSALSEKIVRLRRTYLAKLPQTLAKARQGCGLLAACLADDRVVDDLFCCFHNIKGTAASLGLPKISAESAAATEMVRQLRRLDSSARKTAQASALEDLGACISRMESDAGSLSLEPAPEVPAQPRPTVAKPLADVADTGRRVVFYCDNDLDGAELGTQLSWFGYGFTSFTDPEALKAAVLADPPDAVIMSTAGAEVMAELRRDVDVPALFVSKNADFDARLRAVQAGGEAYFLKPVAAHDIVDVLDRVTTRNEPDPFRILIVDDEPEMADYHAVILEAAGMVVRQINQPSKILKELGEFLPDLVLMDMYMPSCSGRDLSRLIRQIPQFVSLPIIFLSSETDKTVQVSLMRVGADGFLTKPISPEDLVSAVAVRAERTRVLRSLMMRDSLTGLLNHTALLHFLDTSLASARRSGQRLCVAMLDLDHFKKVNDVYGHPAGDQVLMALARMLEQRLRNSDVVGRYGGEEFAIVLQGVAVGEAMAILDQILRDFSALTFTVDGVAFSCSFSAGIAGFPDIQAADNLVKAADEALYSAKRDGRHQIKAVMSHDRFREGS
jgi:diguanylate cyclase (GGDEF)-like protein